MRSKADFKALRETLGMSQQRLADAMRVKILSVKRWEKPPEEAYKPPEEAWAILDNYKSIQDDTIRGMVEAIEIRADENPDLQFGTVHLTYFRSQEEFEAMYPNERNDYQMINATNRLIAHDLEQLGYEVEFGYNIIYHL